MYSLNPFAGILYFRLPRLSESLPRLGIRGYGTQPLWEV
jgi:hypothetical protein